MIRLYNINNHQIFNRFYNINRLYSTTTAIPNKSLRLTIIGAPGSGKGTQSAKLQRDYGVSPISTGQILREAAEEPSDFGKLIKEKVSNGDLISNDIMLQIIQKSLLQTKNGWLLDGYPRTPDQAHHLDTLLQERNIPLDLVLYLDVPEHVLSERIQDRWVHPRSGRVYHSVFSPPKVSGIDDVTGEPLIRRSDDKDQEVFKHRIDTFKESTFPLLKYYKEKGLLYSIDSPTSDLGYIKIKQVVDTIIANK
ncbi:adenylate kinase [Tieghemostelium lacteum]|uniref:Adenylate kinase n=1 Tax=Tieghemostelium lacteum TaxID=361077 RepID=A0A151ZFI7_TIELA|nr:adenylate kinase [Tieghemostelium lacteum]|eukprot:KYQ92728.1 adenylate kinase [Tieghemostelium lacteum]